MPVDLEYLREHYSSISDEELLTINRAELVEEARKCIDEELSRRELSPGESDSRDEQEGPDWLDEAAEILSAVTSPGTPPAAELTDARAALNAARVPCYLDMSERLEEPSSCTKQTHVWRLMVPGNLNLHATSLLERDIFNADFEADWKAHLESFSDEEVVAMNPQVAFCGLFDRVERVTRTYAEEIARRGLKSA
jgi:hypothetical protein